MKRILPALLSSIACAGVMIATFNIGGRFAHAESPAPADAGIAAALMDASSGPPTAPHAPMLHDPTSDPFQYLSDLGAAKKLGWPVLVLLLAFGAVELAGFLGKSSSKFAWLSKGRWSAVIAGGTAVIVAAYNALASGGSWAAVGSAALFAGLLYWHPAGTDPAKS